MQVLLTMVPVPYLVSYDPDVVRNPFVIRRQVPSNLASSWLTEDEMPGINELILGTFRCFEV